MGAPSEFTAAGAFDIAPPSQIGNNQNMGRASKYNFYIPTTVC
jgi:hypothetical protein